MTGSGAADTIYFSFRDLGLIILLSVLAALSGALVPSYLFPEGRISDFVYGVLHLPGPGAGVLIFGGILCFWLILGLILVKKPGTAVAMAIALIAFDLLFGNQTVIIQRLDALLFVAILIEMVCLLPLDRKPLNDVLPIILGGLSIVTLTVTLIGQAKQGESDILFSQFPGTFYVFGILGVGCAILCHRYPVRYLTAAGIANMYYMLHFWLFWGTGFVSRFPPDPAMIPVLLLVALVGGVVFASAGYGIGLLLNRYSGTRNSGKAALE